jgi:hypothetical protein
MTMKAFVVILRTIGLISTVALVVLIAAGLTKGLLFQVVGWTCVISFASAFLMRLFKSSLFGYLKKE